MDTQQDIDSGRDEDNSAPTPKPSTSVSQPVTPTPVAPAPVQGVAWEDLSVLLAAIHHRSLNRAAQALGIGQSTASRRITRLEERLQGRLFERLPNGLLPTQLAFELEPHARLIESHMADIERLAYANDAAPRGRVRLAVPDGLASAWLIPRLGDFLQTYPAIDLDLLVGQAVVDLVRREADVAIRFVPPTAPDLIARKLATLPMGAFVHPDLAGAKPADLRWIAFVDPQELYLETRWIRTHVAPARVLRVSSWNALYGAVQQGLGAALLSPVVAVPAGLVAVAPELPPVPHRELFLAYHRALRDVPRVKAVTRWLLDTIAEEGWA